jgi:hypothetical protein
MTSTVGSGFAQSCIEARTRVKTSRIPALVSGAVVALFLIAGAVATLILQNPLYFLLCMVTGVASALLFAFLSKLVLRRKSWNSVRSAFRQALGGGMQDTRITLLAELDNLFHLVPRLSDDAAYALELTGETVDYLAGVIALASHWKSPADATVNALNDVEEWTLSAQSLLIQLQDGLIEDPVRVASARADLSAQLAKAESKAFPLELLLVTERSALAELAACVEFLRHVVGGSKETMQMHVDSFLARRRSLRSESLAVMQQWVGVVSAAPR